MEGVDGDGRPEAGSFAAAWTRRNRKATAFVLAHMALTKGYPTDRWTDLYVRAPGRDVVEGPGLDGVYDSVQRSGELWRAGLR